MFPVACVKVIVSVDPTVPASVSEYVTSPSAFVTREDDATAPFRPAIVTVIVLFDIPLPYSSSNVATNAFVEAAATRRLLSVTEIAVGVSAAAVNEIVRVASEFNVAVNESPVNNVAAIVTSL
jgi:hypothetical protein